MIDCRLKIGGAWFADSRADLDAGAPTALADLDITWGRATTVDQPDAATARVAVLDRAGGDSILDALPIGATLEVWSSGDIGGTGEPANVAVDGGFEALTLGDPGDRVSTVPGAAVVVDAPTAAGTRAIRLIPAGGAYSTVGINVMVPPAAFTPGDLTGWDAIPPLVEGQTWQWSLTVRAPRGADVTVRPMFFASPELESGGLGADSIPVPVPADELWHQTGAAYTVPASRAGTWLGVYLTVAIVQWLDNPPGTWAATPGTWADYAPTYFDELEVLAPASATRDVLVFAGRVTDLAVTVDVAHHTARVDVLAIDQLADLANVMVGSVPWVSETVTARVAHIVTGLGVDTRIDEPLGALVVSWRDVDNQPAAALLTELAAGIDSVLWSATHATTGAYLWFENVDGRASLGTLALVGGVVVVVVDHPSGRAAGRTVLDGCELTAEGVTWRRDVTDVLTRVDATWLEQTLEAGLPAPTERNLTVADTAAEAAYGVRRIGVATQLTTAPAADSVADGILARTRIPQWRCEGLLVDTARWPPAPGIETADVLDLLDGTTRLGRGLIIENIDGWPGGDSAGAYLDGGSYSFDGAWRLALATTPMGGYGESAPWVALEPAWQWQQFDPELAWSDLFGVTGPIPVGE